MRRVISLYRPTDRLRRASKDAPPRDKPLVTAMMQGQPQRRIAELEEQVALTSRVDIEGVTGTEDGPPLACD